MVEQVVLKSSLFSYGGTNRSKE